ncbi:MAG: hypothetical protein ACRD2L_20160 [Terriglobia bacterium]
MFARILQFEMHWEKKVEFTKVFKNEILPILKKQAGFLEVLPLFPEMLDDKKVLNISFWATKLDAERYEREWYPKIYDILKPYLTSAVTVKYYTVDTTLCEHFEKALVA